MKIEIRELTCGYHGKALLQPLSLELEQGRIVCVLGPNGVGKTTLFKTIQNFLRPLSGTILFDGRPADQWSRKELAKKLAYVPQARSQPFSYSAFDMILMGRAPYLSSLAAPSPEDEDVCSRVMEELGIGWLSERKYGELSGGEQQMVLIARALVQEPEFLLMDEPASNLDYGNQMQLLRQLLRLKERGMGVVMITHAPDHAFLCADQVVLFNRNHSAAVGPTEEILTQQALSEAYGIPVRLLRQRDENGRLVTTCAPQLQ